MAAVDVDPRAGKIERIVAELGRLHFDNVQEWTAVDARTKIKQLIADKEFPDAIIDDVFDDFVETKVRRSEITFHDVVMTDHGRRNHFAFVFSVDNRGKIETSFKDTAMKTSLGNSKLSERLVQSLIQRDQTRNHSVSVSVLDRQEKDCYVGIVHFSRKNWPFSPRNLSSAQIEVLQAFEDTIPLVDSMIKFKRDKREDDMKLVENVITKLGDSGSSFVSSPWSALVKGGGSLISSGIKKLFTNADFDIDLFTLPELRTELTGSFFEERISYTQVSRGDDVLYRRPPPPQQ